jgi:hypothetical protein
MRLTSKILILVMLVIGTACSSKKKLVEKKPIPVSICGIYTDSLSQYFPLLDTSASHDWLKIKGDLNAEFKGKGYEINIQIRIKPNDTVWISMTKASFPILKLLATKDSVLAMDLFNKKYLKTDYIGLSKRIGVEVNFNLFQSVLLAQYIPLPNDDFNWEQEQELTLANLSKSNLNKATEELDSNITFVWAQWIACASKSMSKQYFMVPSTKEELWIKSSNPDTSTYLTIPKEIEVTTLVAKNKKVFIALNYKRFKQASTMNVPFKIPDNYAEME